MQRVIGSVVGTIGLGVAGFALFAGAETSQLPLEARIGQEAAPNSSPDDTSRASCECLVATLRVHHPEGSAWHLPLGEDTLLATAAKARAGLPVMGGHGHGELREMVLGGCTRSVLGGAAVPVPMVC